jgi:hypothetical protein
LRTSPKRTRVRDAANSHLPERPYEDGSPEHGADDQRWVNEPLIGSDRRRPDRPSSVAADPSRCSLSVEAASSWPAIAERPI